MLDTPNSAMQSTRLQVKSTLEACASGEKTIMKKQILLLKLLHGLIVLALLITALGHAHAQTPDTRYFPETGHSVSEEFLAKYLAAPQPLMLYGYPLTEQFVSRDGKLVQYFQRARFELNTDPSAGQRVLLTPLGRELYTPESPLNFYNPQDCEFFAQTGFWVCFDFLRFFQQNGGLSQFGFPVSPFEFHNNALVQYFENARFEWQPAMPEGQRISLADLGHIYFDKLGEDPAVLNSVPDPAQPTPSATAFPLPSPAPVFDTNTVEYFPRTGHTVPGEFLQQYRAAPNPSLVYGDPITEQFTDRTGLVVQYFERARFELHTDPPFGQRVRVTSIGSELHTAGAQLNVYNPQDCQYFDQTGYWVCFSFLDFFNDYGGIAQFGYPISPFEYEGALIVQYFEKARLEWHPFAWDGQTVAVGDLGRAYFDYRGEDIHLLAAVPSLLDGSTQVTATIEWTLTPTMYLTDTATPTPPSDIMPAEASPTLIPTETVSPEPPLTPLPGDTFTPESTPTLFPLTAVASETPTASPTPSPAPSFTPTPTLTPTETLTPTPTPIPTFVILRGTVLELSNCRYGPGQPYLYKYGLLKGNRMEIFGRNDAGTWVYVRAIGGHNPCWVKASLLSITGDVMSVEPVYPDKAPLPKSPYYPPLTGVKATRSGDQVRITWTGVTLRAGDEESPTSPLYLVEVWTCHGGQIVFTPIGAYDNVAYVNDESGCSTSSHGRVFLSEKHGYAGPTEIPWP